MRLLCVLVTGLGLAVAAAATNAATVIDFNEEFGGETYEQDGFQLSAGGFPFFFGGDRPFLEVDIFATPQPQFYQLLRSDGAAFSLISFLLAPGSANYVFPEPQNDLQLTGYLDGAVVASAAVTSQGGAATYDALSGFSAIDRLELRSVFTQNARDEFESSGADVFVTLDNLTLDAAMYVPLPPSFAALGAALALMGLAASRRRA